MTVSNIHHINRPKCLMNLRNSLPLEHCKTLKSSRDRIHVILYSCVLVTGQKGDTKFLTTNFIVLQLYGLLKPICIQLLTCFSSEANRK